ncbi:MAG: NAD(P)H-quinone dehydrogenase [Actinomycetota bacterium]|nr:NAD(P)H-quinone dehydrogenase [Actinomycetota bacterium]
MTAVVIVGGGPGGYEAALVAAQMGAEVTLVDSDGIGGSAVLTDCVPSKALLAVAESATQVRESPALGITGTASTVGVDLAAVNARILDLAVAQSQDTARRCAREGVRLLAGRGRLEGPGVVVVDLAAGGTERIEADAILLATGARPRVLDTAVPDGDRILTWEQVYSLAQAPERLVVVGSGVTGAEFACAYQALGSEVVLVSSREHVLPGEDLDAAQVLEDVFERRGMTVLRRSRAVSATRTTGGVLVTLADGRTVEGSHCLMAVGSVPNTDDLALADAGVRTNDAGFIEVDRVSRTSARGVYAAGDCTGVFLLASVAAMQGRIAMWHALGGAVAPLDLRTVSSNVFTDPEIATVGYTQADVDSGRVNAEVVTLPLATNARAKMQGMTDGFVKVLCRRGTRIVIGGVVVAPKASELVFGLSLAVEQRMTVDEVAATFTVYPSLTGSIAEAARRLRAFD